MECNDSAATRVFDTAELLELIFLQVPHKNLAKLQLVSKYARDLINTSTKIQCKLCLLPVEGVTVKGDNPNRAFRLGKEHCSFRMRNFDTFEWPYFMTGELHVTKLHATKMKRTAKGVLSINPDSEILGAVYSPNKYLLINVYLYGDNDKGVPNTNTMLKLPKGIKIADILTSAKELDNGKEPSIEGVQIEWVKQEVYRGWKEVYVRGILDSRRK